MEALDSGCSRIDYKHITLCVTHDLQDMRVTADKNIWFIFINQFLCPDIISSGISADMGHQNLHTLTLEKTMKRVDEAEVVIVTIAGDTCQRLETGNLCSKIHPPAEIPGMPYLIDRFKKLLEAIIKYSVCVRYQSDVHFIRIGIVQR